MGTAGTTGSGAGANSGINLLGHSTVAGGSIAAAAAAAASASSNNYNMGGANFGLGAIGNLANLGGNYLTKGNVMNTSGSISSAYATNASDLIRGFKSSQSIPVVTSQQASMH